MNRSPGTAEPDGQPAGRPDAVRPSRLGRLAGTVAAVLVGLAAILLALLVTAAADPQSPHWLDSPIEASPSARG